MWYIHVGAHGKMGRALIRIMRANSSIIDARQLVVPPANFQRKMFRQILRGDPNRTNALETLSEFLDSDKEPTGVVLSVQNLLADPQHIVSDGSFYPSAESRIKLLSNTIKGIPCSVFLEVRSLTGFFPSIANATLRKNIAGIDWTEIYEFSWLPVIQSIRRSLPRASIVVISHDRAAVVFVDILKTIFNDNLPDDFRFRYSFLRGSITESGQAALKKELSRNSNYKEVITNEELSRIYSQYKIKEDFESSHREYGWDNTLVELLDSKYHIDLKKIAKISGVTVL
jgi:hypothetical protein